MTSCQYFLTHTAQKITHLIYYLITIIDFCKFMLIPNFMPKNAVKHKHGGNKRLGKLCNGEETPVCNIWKVNRLIGYSYRYWILF